jgi:hypothetical protein
VSPLEPVAGAVQETRAEPVSPPSFEETITPTFDGTPGAPTTVTVVVPSDERKAWSPEYVAVTSSLPTGNVVGHIATPPVIVTARQPEIGVPAISNATAPVGTPIYGLCALTVAVSISCCPSIAVEGELARAVASLARPTVPTDASADPEAIADALE